MWNNIYVYLKPKGKHVIEKPLLFRLSSLQIIGCGKLREGVMRTDVVST